MTLKYNRSSSSSSSCSCFKPPTCTDVRWANSLSVYLSYEFVCRLSVCSSACAQPAERAGIVFVAADWTAARKVAACRVSLYRANEPILFGALHKTRPSYGSGCVSMESARPCARRCAPVV